MSQLPSPVSTPTSADSRKLEFQFDPTILDLPQLASEFTLRPLSSADYERNYLEVLAGLTVVGEITKEQFEARFDFLRKHAEIQQNIVIEHLETGNVVGAASLILDRKFVHNCGMVAHIEDVVVDGSMRGKNLGLALIETLKRLAMSQGAYKVILNCKESNVPFYEKAGFERREREMACYFQ